MRSKPCLTSSDLKTMMDACLAEAEKNKWTVAVSIVDEGGYLLSFHRMDGVAPISAEVSLGKARTSALTRRPSKFFEDRVKERPAFANFPAGLLDPGRPADPAPERMRRRDRGLRRGVAGRREDRPGGHHGAGVSVRAVTLAPSQPAGGACSNRSAYLSAFTLASRITLLHFTSSDLR